jgi:hypothetical protein
MLVDGTDLNSWANRRDAQSVLPQLLRRLIHATVERGRILRIGFPSGEGVQLGGWDGIVAVGQGNAFVPDGVSAWEMGATAAVKGKADGDYAKRCEEPLGVDPAQSTFVFVTPRRWGGKDEWVRGKQDEGIWSEVRAYDADDLEQWLELAPAVHVWLSILLGKHPEDAMDLGSFWADWSEATRPATSPAFLLSGRGEVVESVHTWLREPSGPLALRAESRDEALAVFAATLRQLPSEEFILYLSRAIVVHTISAWYRITASDEPLILVPAFDNREAVTRATRTGHHVVIPLGRADSASANTIEIPRLSREGAVKALTAAGIHEEHARELATLARRSLTSFRRRLALSPEVQQPEWARPSEARALLPAMLTGGWNDSAEGDRIALAALAQSPYEDVSRILVRWSNEADPPVRSVGDAWYIVSKEDAWVLLARYLTRDDLERFENVVLEVLGAADPRFDLPNDQRWMARVLRHAPRHSGLLREGLADTLAIMGARGDVTLPSAGVSARDFASRILRRLLERTNEDWRVWASLSHSLSLLAEAAPDTFLSAVGDGVAGEHPVLLNLFSESGNPLFSSSPHTGLLWALETLAWNPQHLGHTALLLAKLARIDPGGHLTNRPQNSLHDVFRLWLPQTTATLEQRLRVIDGLREREPDVAWKLMSQLLPEHHEMGRYTSKPRWHAQRREWEPDEAPRVTQGEYIKAIGEIVTRMLDDAGESGSRWSDLIKALDTLPADQHQYVAERLASIDAERLQPPDRNTVWHSLRELISRHRSFSDTDWALPAERVDRLEEILRRFEPREPPARYGWLFEDFPNLPEGLESDWDAHQEITAKARLDAVNTIYNQAGLEGLLELVGAIAQSGELGATLGRSDLATEDEDHLLREYLAADDPARALFARGFTAGRVSSRGREWAEAKLAEVGKDLSPAQQAQLLSCLPYDARTWGLVEGAGEDTEHQYWRIILPYGIEGDDVERVARKLLENGRPYTAVRLLALHVRRKQTRPAGLVADALERVLQTSPDDDPMSSSFAHDASTLLDVLQTSDEIEQSRAASLEWAFLPVFGYRERTPKLLQHELTQNPNFFAEMVALVYRAEGEESREVSEEGQLRTQRAYELLRNWRTPPGTADDGTINADTLRNWIRQAREVMGESGRSVIGDQTIGQVLSGSPHGDDGAWPHPAVRDLIEEVASIELERGLEVGLYNSRGVITRDLREGGAQEHSLAERYTGYAATVSDRWPRTAAMLRRIADTYRADARREDLEAELREDLGG